MSDFSSDWLNERFRFDAIARNKTVQSKCFQLFNTKKSLQILDIGSGTGANCKYFIPLLSQNQHWTLVESQTDLAVYSLDHLQEWGNKNGFSASRFRDSVLLEKEQQQIHIDIKITSVLDIEELVDLSTIDLVVANAVFDLFSKKDFQTVANLLHKNKVVFMPTINYTGMEFGNQTPTDLHYIQLYESHMNRPQSFGQSMGKFCKEGMLNALKVYEHQIVGESNWKIGATNSAMLGYLIGFMHEAIGELLTTDAEQTALNVWIADKKQAIQKQELSLVVEHFDVLAY